MELYFKDLESDGDQADEPLNCAANEVVDESGDMAEDIAFAELAERVSAARSVY